MIPAADTVIEIRRIFSAPRERVFRAWTQPELLMRWMGKPEFVGLYAVVDLTVGGRYRLELKTPAGASVFVGGTYLAIHTPEKLVYTWLWEHDAASDETLVTVHFRAVGPQTEVILRHERFPDLAARDLHTQGWHECLERLADLLA